MQSSILNNLGFDPGILIIIVLVFLVFILLYLSSVSIKMSRFMKRYKIFMRGKDGVSLERAFESNFIEVDRIGEQNKIQAQEIARLREQMSRTPVKTLAMLDMNNTGFVMNAIHSKEGCYTYIKEIVKGESYIVLGQEEKDALRQAVISYENQNSDG